MRPRAAGAIKNPFFRRLYLMTVQSDQTTPEEFAFEEEEDWTKLLEAYDYARPQRGELRDGLIMQIEENGVLVSIGTKREGVIPVQDLRQMGDDFSDTLNVGDSIQVYVQDPENRDGDLILSLTMVQVAKDWENAGRLFEEGGVVQCKVVGFNKGGLLVQFNRIRGFVPASQVAQLHGRTAAEERQQALQRMVNQEIPLKVIEVDRDRNRLVLSERSATQEWRKAQKQRLLTELQPGDVLTGRVNQLTNFGAFIDLGGADGLAHISELSWQRVNHPREVLSPGQEVQVLVVEIDRDRERIGLSLRRLQPNPWDTIDQRYNLGQLVTGPVTNVTPFGAFVQIEEAVEGLIHASELDVDPQTQPRDVLSPGQVVTAKVISLDRQRQRMGLSLRRVTEEERDGDEVEGGETSVAEATPATEAETSVAEATPATEAETSSTTETTAVETPATAAEEPEKAAVQATEVTPDVTPEVEEPVAEDTSDETGTTETPSAETADTEATVDTETTDAEADTEETVDVEEEVAHKSSPA
jgi:small subunit ribosomal protein S1